MYYTLGYGEYQPWIATFSPAEEECVNWPDNVLEWRPGECWIPPKIQLTFKNRGRKRYACDRLYDSCMLLISARAAKIIRPIISNNCHILPVDNTSNDQEFFYLWTPVIENSLPHGYNSFPAVKEINALVVENSVAFRPSYPGQYEPYRQNIVLVNDLFCETWINAGLSGIKFHPIGNVRDNPASI